MINQLLEPWQFAFMQNAFLAIIIVGITSGIIGTFVVLRGVGFLGDALAHAIFPGLAIAFITGGNIIVGAVIAAIIVSLLIGAISQHQRVNNDTAIGVLFVGAFALGIALMTSQTAFQRDLTSFLFGSILGVTRENLATITIVSVALLAVLYYFRREITMISFDRTFAAATGLHIWRYDQLFLILLALTIVAGLQIVGNVLILAMLITPAATARLLTDRLWLMAALSAIIGACSGVVGLYVSWYQGIASGSAVVLAATVVFFLTYLFAPNTGIITPRVRRALHHPNPEHDEPVDASTMLHND
ncbi:anchored repeat-type ABC transporter permease subunit [soil metagenome]